LTSLKKNSILPAEKIFYFKGRGTQFMKKSIKFFIAQTLLNAALLANHSGETTSGLFYQGYDVAPLIALENKSYNSDISFNFSFLYYQAAQDGLDLANSATINTNGIVSATDNSISLIQDFTFNPGFKTGIGLSCNDWILNADYTWIRQTTTTNQDAITPNPAQGTGVWTLNNWFQQTSSVGQTMSATNISSDWNLEIDSVDVTLSRASYEGQNLAIMPFFGVRAAWTRQDLNLAVQVPSDALSNLVRTPANSLNNSSSWAVGPRTGCHASWLCGHGLRITGDVGADILCTQYDVHHSEEVASSTTDQLSVQMQNFTCLRPELDLSLGLGWSTYCKNERCYLDFSVHYDFVLLCQQNMMRKLMDQSLSGIGAAAGDLYMHGINAQIALYF